MTMFRDLSNEFPIPATIMCQKTEINKTVKQLSKQKKSRANHKVGGNIFSQPAFRKKSSNAYWSVKDSFTEKKKTISFKVISWLRKSQSIISR